MKHIDSFLGKKNLTPVLDKKNECIRIVLQHTGITINPKNISFSGTTVFLKTDPHQKILILQNKQKIINVFATSKYLSFFIDLQ